MTAARETLQVLWTGINGEAIEAVAVRSGMKSVCLHAQIVHSRILTLSALNPPELLDYRSAGFARLDHSCDGGRFVPQARLEFWG